MNSLVQDVRYGLRMLRKSPGFAAVAVLTLALGIGANAAIFTLLDQVMLRALPVPDPGRLVVLKSNNVDEGSLRSRMAGGYYFSEPMYRELARRADALSGLLARAPSWAGVNWRGRTEQVDSELVSGNYFEVLQVRPALGRLLLPADDRQKNGSPVVVLSYAFWQRRFGGARDVVGQTLSINSHPFTIVGVTPPGFRSAVVGEAPAIFMPLDMQPQAMPGFDEIGDWRGRWLNLVGRLKPGVSREQAQAQLGPVWHALREDDLQRLLAAHRAGASGKFGNEFLASPLLLEAGAKGLSPLRHDIGAPLLLLMAMVGLVLLIACANVATLLLARGAARQHEIAIRFALGAPRRRVLRQLLAETLLLGLLGGGLGLLLSPWVSRLLLGAVPPEADLSNALSANVDGRVLLFTFGVAVLTSLLAGMAPALRYSRRQALALKEQSFSVAGGASRLRRVLVAGQIGLTVVLLVSAGMLTHSLFNLKNADLGFSTERTYTFSVNAKLGGYSDEGARQLYQRVNAELQRLPGVTAVASSTVGLLDFDTSGDNITIDSYHPAPDEDMDQDFNYVSPGYLHAMKIALLAGRDFGAGDAGAAPKVCIVNATLARRYFGGAQQALGHWIALGSGKVKPNIQIVGVAGDSKYAEVKQERTPGFIYVPYLQQERQNAMTYYVRTAAPAEEAAAEIRGAVRNVDSNLPVQYLETMDEHVNANLFLQRLVAALSLSFGGLAAALAAVGLYGVLAYSVAQRTREIGVRMALGATGRQVLGLVLRETALLVGIGSAAGLVVAAGATRLLQSVVFEIRHGDPLSFALAIVILSAVALLASYIPARRAARVDPMVALRYE